MLAVIRGAGDLASGIAIRLYRSGIKVVMTDLEKPLAIRRTVAFCEAIRFSVIQVEEVTACVARSAEKAMELLSKGYIPVMPDPEGKCIKELKPDIVIDAILAKKNLGTAITDAPVVIGVGPGFCAGEDCHAVIETMRGHTLGRVIYSGTAAENTGIPGTIGGVSAKRVLRAPAAGVFMAEQGIGARVKEGDLIGWVGDEAVTATIDGILRGLIARGTEVTEGLKIGDIDPRGEDSYCRLVSDKALAIGGGVLEAVLALSGVLKEK